jgi:AraC family transcriptional activator of pobA
LKTAIDIPEYNISGQARHGLLIAGLENQGQYQNHEVAEPHRDDHFTFLVLTSGIFELMVDFERLTIDKKAVVIIRPEQVHQVIGRSNATGWLLNVDAAAISSHTLAPLYAHITGPVFLDSNSVLTAQILSLLSGVDVLLSENVDEFLHSASLNLVDALFKLVVSLAVSQKTLSGKSNRASAVYQQFQSLLQDNFKEWKQPHLYAQAIALSPVHVNDIVRKQSGYSVSHHIQARNVLEAKRLLFYTDKNINEIGYLLGYENPLYFGKLFKKHTQLSPTQFRATYRV